VFDAAWGGAVMRAFYDAWGGGGGAVMGSFDTAWGRGCDGSIWHGKCGLSKNSKGGCNISCGI
jgi:hypothetical protein